MMKVSPDQASAPGELLLLAVAATSASEHGGQRSSP